MKKKFLLTLTTALVLSACSAEEAPQSETAVAEAASDEIRDAFDNEPFIFFGPAGTYDSVSSDGASYSTTLNPDYSYVMVADGRRETGRWTVDGALTCMSPGDGNVHSAVSGHGEQRQSRCFVITEDTSVTECPKPRTDFPPAPINCVVASPPDASGKRTLTQADGSVATTQKRAELADLPGNPADRTPYLFESPVGVWETTGPDGAKHQARHNENFTTVSESGEVVGHWTVQGPLTCMKSAGNADRATCFVISEDPEVECPELEAAGGIENIMCIVASPLREDGTRTLTSPDGRVSVTRRIG